MATKGYEVLVEELTVHRGVREIKHPVTNESVGWQQGRGQTYYEGEVIPEDAVSPDLIAILSDSEHPGYESLSQRLRPVSDDPKENTELRLGIPFAGYSDMTEDEILSAMSVLPSATVQRIKEYEAQYGDNRDRIVQYNIGYGESPTDRQEDKIASKFDEDNLDDTKPARQISTREVPEDGPVVPGEGITGTGEPNVPHGSRKAEEDDDETAPKRTSPRRSRRTRTQRPKADAESTEGDDDKTGDES